MSAFGSHGMMSPCPDLEICTVSQKMLRARLDVCLVCFSVYMFVCLDVCFDYVYVHLCICLYECTWVLGKNVPSQNVQIRIPPVKMSLVKIFQDKMTLVEISLILTPTLTPTITLALILTITLAPRNFN